MLKRNVYQIYRSKQLCFNEKNPKLPKLLRLSGTSGNHKRWYWCINFKRYGDRIHPQQRLSFAITSFLTQHLKILADAIASFRFLTVDDSEKLLKLIESLCSIYEAPLLRREIMLTNRVKSDNEQIFDNIDMINSAFRNNLYLLK